MANLGPIPRRASTYHHLVPYQLLPIFLLLNALFLTFTQPYLIFANRKDIRKLDDNFVYHKRPFNTSVIVDQLEDAAAIDFDYDSKIIFWTDLGLETIKGIRLNDGHIFDVITSGIVSPDGLACDWITKKLYWADSETNRIEVSHYDGSYRTVLFWKDLDQPRAIVLVPSEGLMFWSDWGEVPKIERASMDGNNSTRKVIIKEDIYWPNGLAVDYETRRLYWSDAKLGYISSVDFDGHNQATVSKGNMSHILALTLHADILYWTDLNRKGIYFCNKTTGVRGPSYQSDLSPLGINVFDASRQPKSSSVCDINNGGCSHLCLLSAIAPHYTCACPTGVKLMQDGKTCRSSAEKILLLARRVDIRRISLDTNDYTAVVLPIKGIKHAVALDYDPIDGKVYWTDDDLHVIKRSMLNGSEQETIITNEVNHPDGVAIDWIARNIYWVDSGTFRIEVSRLDGSYRKILLNEDLDKPRAIVVHPVEGLMFWTDWGEKAKIERASLDGSDRVVIVNTSLIWPNGLAIDYELSFIYWGDAKTDKIEMSKFDGTERRTLISKQLPHLFGFTLLNEWVYWSDWQRRSVERAHKLTGNDRETIVDNLPDLMGLKAMSISKPVGTNPCALNNGNCSHLCLNKPHNQYVCACPTGFELDDDLRNCSIPESYFLFLQNDKHKDKNDIRRMSFTSKTFDVVRISGLHSATSFDMNVAENRIYYADKHDKLISRSFINGSGLEHIVQLGIENPTSLAVDWVAKNLYWSDFDLKRIEVARLDGSYRRILFHDRHSNSLAVNPINAYLFWSDWTNGKIERSFLDGTKRKTIVDSAGHVVSLTIDFKDQRLYWISSDVGKYGTIMSSLFDGSKKASLVHDEHTTPNSLAVFNDLIYFVDRSAKTVESLNKTNSLQRGVFKKDDLFQWTTDIFVYNTLNQNGWNFCVVNNGGCQHLCFARPNNQRSNQPEFYCSCASHYTLYDERFCQPPEAFLLFSQKSTITRFLFDPEQIKNDFQDIILPMQNMKNIKALAYDQLEHYIYWIDGRMQAIKRVYVNGTGVKVVHSKHHSQAASIHPEDLVIDPYSRILFWTCSVTNSINATRIIGDPVSIGAVYHSNYDQPRLLAYHFRLNFLFWTNHLNYARIERISFPNLIKTTVVKENLEDVISIAVDQELDLLVWSDGKSKSIEYSNIHGMYRATLYQEADMHPISMAVYSKFLFWIEKDKRTIEKLPLDLNLGKNKQTIFTKLMHLTDIIAVPRMNKTSSNLYCTNENAGCSHICIITSQAENKMKCACPRGLILSEDEKSCVEPTDCQPNQFKCLSGNCIRDVFRCNGSPECLDGSDELNCPKCGPNQFTCFHELVCRDNRHLCDGVTDCIDGYDEICCGKDHFRCKSRNCLTTSQLCDRKMDCLDGEDEDARNCPKFVPNTPPNVTTKSTYSFFILIILFVILILIFLFYQCKRNSHVEKEPGVTDILMIEQRATLQTAGIGKNNRAPHRPTDTLPKDTVHMSLDGGNGGLVCSSMQSDSLIERNITGASSTSSSAHINYPRETTNPPPSPVTERSQYSSYSSSLFVPRSRTRSKNSETFNGGKNNRRHKKSRWKSPAVRGPPPTPCSTDVYEDIEPSTIKYIYYDNSHTEIDDLDYKPPPPTPRNYFSDPSCPPSPATERSFCNPYPPPPSPVQEYD